MRPILDLHAVNAELEHASPQEIIRWSYRTFGPKLAMLSSLQKTASALTYILYAEGMTDVEIIFIDTGYHFQETLDLRDRMIERYGVNIKTYHPKMNPEEQFRTYGRELYLKDGDYQVCCRMRKEEPYLRAAEPFDAIVSGLMRSEGGARKNLQVVTEDPRINGYKIHPLLNWSVEDVKNYLNMNQVLVHPLHNLGYPSIGCFTCTTAVKPDEDERAGRWRHIREANPNGPKKLYCGINFSDRQHAEPKREPKPTAEKEKTQELCGTSLSV